MTSELLVQKNFVLTQELLSMVKPPFKKKKIRMRQPVPAGERLATILRFLVTGETYDSLMYHQLLRKLY